jgi:hypothetical protein
MSQAIQVRREQRLCRDQLPAQMIPIYPANREFGQSCEYGHYREFSLGIPDKPDNICLVVKQLPKSG